MDIGNIVLFDSRLIFSAPDYVCVRVQADVLDPNKGMDRSYHVEGLIFLSISVGKSDTTNIFYYDWDVKCDKKLIPCSEDENYLVALGREKYEASKSSNQENLDFRPYMHPVVRFPSLTALKTPPTGPMHPFPLSAFYGDEAAIPFKPIYED